MTSLSQADISLANTPQPRHPLKPVTCCSSTFCSLNNGPHTQQVCSTAPNPASSPELPPPTNAVLHPGLHSLTIKQHDYVLSSGCCSVLQVCVVTIFSVKSILTHGGFISPVKGAQMAPIYLPSRFSVATCCLSFCTYWHQKGHLFMTISLIHLTSVFPYME